MSRIETDAHAEDVRLQGRTYAIPFDAVWTATLDLIQRSRRWKVVSADDQQGRIHVEALSLVFRHTDDLYFHIGLDEDAQTRVDLRGHTRGDKRDLGRKARVVGRFLRRLDAALKATPDQILDPRARRAWSS